MKDKMQVLKKAFLVLMVLDLIKLILMVIEIVPTLKQMSEYGQMVLIVGGVIATVEIAVLLFEVWGKFFLSRSTSPAFSWESARRGYVAVARLLLLINLGAAIIDVLSVGGVGATLINQAYLYLCLLASIAEMIAVFLYLRATKKLLADAKRG